MEEISKKIKDITETNIFKTIAVIVVAIVIYAIIKKILNILMDKTTKGDSRKKKKKATYFVLGTSALKYIIVIVTALLVLEVNGVNITSLITGLGIVGIVVGLAVQDALKDIIGGKNIIADNYFQVGDVVQINEHYGKVVSIGLKSIKLKDPTSNNIITIANRNVDKAIIMSDWLAIKVPAPYDVDIKTMTSVIHEMVKVFKKIDNVKDVNYVGISDLGESSISYLIRVDCAPENKGLIKIKCLTLIKKIMDEKNIAIPYNQLDVHIYK